eukprot:355986-Chlamydomonas_euryale.AAC.14
MPPEGVCTPPPPTTTTTTHTHTASLLRGPQPPGMRQGLPQPPHFPRTLTGAGVILVSLVTILPQRSQPETCKGGRPAVRRDRKGKAQDCLGGGGFGRQTDVQAMVMEGRYTVMQHKQDTASVEVWLQE